MFETKIIDYKDYGKCLSITNGIVDLAVTIDIGPRIIRYGFVGGQNIMLDDRSFLTPNANEKFKKYYGEDKFYCGYGGHRLWISPEYYPEMYYPDNDPVKYEIVGNTVIFTPPAQVENDLQHSITVTLSEDSTEVTVDHKVENIGDRTKEFALWALTMAAKGGLEIIPMNTQNTHLLPNRKIVFWPYTNPQADNIFLGKQYTTVEQPEAGALKLGFDLKDGIAYYVLGDDVFTKKYYPNYPNGVYPDGGVSFETYSCTKFTELETLGEYKKVAPGEIVSHVENWSLCKKPCDVDRKDEASITAFIEKL